MKIKNIILSLCMMLSAFILAPSNICSADTVEEKYCKYFNDPVSDGIVSIQNIQEEDKVTLYRLISKDDLDMVKYLGNGFSEPDMSEMIDGISDDVIKLTIRDPDANVIGQIVFSGTEDYNFHVIYWIGQAFRGKGYMSKAITAAMQKIWEIDSSVKFYFAIDDENIASQNAIKKACHTLNSHLEKCEAHKVKIIATRTEEWYNVRTLQDEEEVDCRWMSECEFIKYFPKESVERDTLISASITMYSAEQS